MHVSVVAICLDPSSVCQTDKRFNETGSFKPMAGAVEQFFDRIADEKSKWASRFDDAVQKPILSSRQPWFHPVVVSGSGAI
jgi:hypothetical protein